MVNIIGRVERGEYWHTLSDGTQVSYHTALNNGSMERTTFVSPKDVWASVTAQNLGIRYEFLRNATNKEIKDFIKEHK